MQIDEEFWVVRKQNFILMKEWEEDRALRETLLAKVVFGIFESIIHRLGSAQFENEQLMSYFKNYAKLMEDHSQALIKN